MGISARALAADHRLDLTIVAGEAAADRPIRWVHAIELVDPTPWLSGDELVMTTGLALPLGDDERIAYVDRLADVGIAALAFDTGTAHGAVPPAVVAAADRRGVPLLAVGPQLPFIAISRVVVDALADDELREARLLSARQADLARAAITGQAAGVVRSLRRTLHCQVVLTDAGGGVAADTSDEDRRLADRVRGLIGPGGRSGTSVIVDEHGTLLVQALSSAARKRAGYLTISASRQLSPWERALVGHAVALLTVESARPAPATTSLLEARRSAHAVLVGTPRSQAALLTALDFDPNAEVVVLAVLGIGTAGRTITVVSRSLDEVRVPHLIGDGRSGPVFTVPESAVATAVEAVRGSIRDGGVRIGISGPTTFSALALAVTRSTAAAMHAVASDRVVMSFDDVGITEQLVAAMPREQLRTLAGALVPLSGTLLDTLRAYLTCNGHLEAAAGVLGIHRHTLRQRLERSERLLGRSLGSAAARVDLWLALRAADLVSDSEMDS
ncbi:PucR family transcriptional regulator [Pseudonocardia sp. NPDC049635]|uniref:PucR family transcriptional regulator n=1 Tax=Pseudonocardia sp. NPDC049635 TaxID=3155506 RepID=UPI00340CD621